MLVLTGIATSTNQTNMYALAASGTHRRKRSAKIAKKKLPKRRRKKQVQIKKRQRKVIKRHAKKRYKKYKSKKRKSKVKKQRKQGLTKAERSAKEWVSWHESRDRWNVVSSVGCYGRYQLTPAYLHGDYSHANQSRTADRYVKNRYGGWIQAKRFWQIHNWY